ncbi:hypothetical protein KKG55_07085, partial [Candidatus Micrarchaeota archaeon]|nr:hypothetical protein [Candidatus Micrarchaeota archaeon]
MLVVPVNKCYDPNYRARRMTQDKLDPRAVLGKKLALLDFNAEFAHSHSSGAWKKTDSWGVPQEMDGFHFDGNALRYYEKIVLRNLFPRNWKGLERIYFPAVFTGKMAKAFADHGYDVFATDLSPDWVENATKLGLR